MATNLSSKLGKEDRVLVYDINTASTKKFVEEAKLRNNGGSVEAVNSVKEAASKSVSFEIFGISDMMNVFSHYL
jgi:hypothetical protein